jgi:hypothetical protein
MHGAAMHNGIVPDGYIIANLRFCFLESAMDYCTILHIHFITHTDAVHIPPYYCIEPDAAGFTHNYITHYGGIRSYETITAPLRKSILYR